MEGNVRGNPNSQPVAMNAEIIYLQRVDFAGTPRNSRWETQSQLWVTQNQFDSASMRNEVGFHLALLQNQLRIRTSMTRREILAVIARYLLINFYSSFFLFWFLHSIRFDPRTINCPRAFFVTSTSISSKPCSLKQISLSVARETEREKERERERERKREREREKY